ncbi:hypothetical protein [Streptococcus suis]|uniref:hypothetical protein n=1 Tax=Streptococcus suis TaxID=1307 RepID=UPI00300F802A
MVTSSVIASAVSSVYSEAYTTSSVTTCSIATPLNNAPMDTIPLTIDGLEILTSSKSLANFLLRTRRVTLRSHFFFTL